MGIKGIYGEIGPGERVALSKLAIEKFEETGRPFRIAIDISIWQFQIQAGQGGSNPAIRTFYYMLLRLMSISIQPLFVFDGPHKPPFKRNKRSVHHGVSIPNLLCKQLLKYFGFPYHVAPGEAEAECALLQREGVVDAVLSEDVDTLMFGSGLTLRNWSSEGRGNKSPTHVSAYHAKATKAGKSGLDREGMILVALMSGGDYITEGIPGCGIKAACEAARAGFGKSLCQLSRSDTIGLETWRRSLIHEIQTNESKFFRVKHKSLRIPDDFPKMEVLGYYTHPVVSSTSKLQRLRDEIMWDGEVDISGLRSFVAEAFDWIHKTGARKFIRGIAPVLLAHKLRLRGERRRSGYDDVVLTAMNEMELVRAICGKRTHFSTDGVPELRVVYQPVDIVGLDLEAEVDDSEDYGRDGLAPTNEDDEIEAYVSEVEPSSRSASPSKRPTSVYDPTQPERLWIFETIAKVGIPLKVEDYEESLRDPKKFLKARAVAKRAEVKEGMPRGAMDRFVSVSKPRIESGRCSNKLPSKTRSGSSIPTPCSNSLAPVLVNFPNLAPASKSSVLAHFTRQMKSATDHHVPIKNAAGPKLATSTSTSSGERMIKPRAGKKATVERSGSGTNPWTIALSSSPQQASSVTKSTDQQYQKGTPKYHGVPRMANTETLQSSSPPPASTSRAQKHPHSMPLESEPEDEIAGDSSIDLGDLAALQIRTPLSSEKDRDRPSPTKKRSPRAVSINSSTTPPPQFRLGRATPEIINPRIDAPSSASRARFSPPDLPPLRQLLFSTPSVEDAQSSDPEYITLSSSPVAKWTLVKEDAVEVALLEQKVNEKKYIMLRESLPGAWREANASELVQGRSRAWRYSQVDCLDLSAD